MPQWCRVGDRLASVWSGGRDAQRAYAAARVITLAKRWLCAVVVRRAMCCHTCQIRCRWRSHSCFDGRTEESAEWPRVSIGFGASLWGWSLASTWLRAKRPASGQVLGGV